ncbi:MAG: hypothetical protein FRX49_06268 [Trebouxia sp. A1-2]|nr:MAG: hypothetical protein FRX49_06268 [Trebouxia sp. A1-2]
MGPQQGHLCCAATGVLQLYTGKVTSTRSESYKSGHSKSLQVSSKLAKRRLMRRARALLVSLKLYPISPGVGQGQS